MSTSRVISTNGCDLARKISKHRVQRYAKLQLDKTRPAAINLGQQAGKWLRTELTRHITSMLNMGGVVVVGGHYFPKWPSFRIQKPEQIVERMP